jgi:hypothetical protein
VNETERNPHEIEKPRRSNGLTRFVVISWLNDFNSAMHTQISFNCLFSDGVENMPAGRPCNICKDPKKTKLVIELVCAGASDQDIANRLGMPSTSGRMCVARHRTKHIEEPARALAIAANKGHAVVKQRKAIEAGELDDTSSFLALDAITTDVRKVAKRLGRAAKATEAAAQYTQMTGVIGQQHKNLELRGRLGAHPGFVPQRASPGDGDRAQFNLVINRPNGTQERLTTVVEAPTANLADAPVVDMPMLDFHIETNDAPAPETRVEQPEESQASKWGRLFGPKK